MELGLSRALPLEGPFLLAGGSHQVALGGLVLGAHQFEDLGIEGGFAAVREQLPGIAGGVVGLQGDDELVVDLHVDGIGGVAVHLGSPRLLATGGAQDQDRHDRRHQDRNDLRMLHLLFLLPSRIDGRSKSSIFYSIAAPFQIGRAGLRPPLSGIMLLVRYGNRPPTGGVMVNIAADMTELVGRTPLVKLNRVTEKSKPRWWPSWSSSTPAAR